MFLYLFPLIYSILDKLLGGKMTFSMKTVMVVALIALMLLPLVSAADIAITVMDKDGDEIEDAQVTIEYSNGTAVDGSCDGDDTDGNGEIDCEGLENDEDYVLKIVHDDYKSIDDNEALENWDDGDDNIAAVMRPKEFNLLIEVTDQEGNEIEEADVSIESLDEELDKDDLDPDDDFDIMVFPDEESTYEPFDYDDDDETDEDGEVEFTNLEFNTLYEITIEKSGHIDTVVEYRFHNEAEDDNVDIELIEPGIATFTAVVRDLETNEVISGAEVTIVGKDNGTEKTASTDSTGAASFTLDTPNCYDIAVMKDGYSTDSQTNLCLENDDEITGPFYLTAQNNPPVANAGEDQYVMVGDVVTLDASGSTDPDGDELTYMWEDSFGKEIPATVNPQVTFDAAREHTITLTVNDGRETATDTVKISVESPQNCGDGVCSIAERNAEGTDNACPEDCPVCKDDVEGAGECDPAANEYCPVDCGIALEITTTNTSELVAGNTTEIVARDPNTGEAVAAESITVTAPNGTTSNLSPAIGRAEYTFSDAGTYTIEASADKYVSGQRTVEIGAVGNLDWLMWVGLVIVIVVVVLLVIRLMNTRGKGGLGSGGKGYRARRYRRGKPSLSSV